MCIIFTCGEHTFRKQVEGYEGVICQCHNCGNYNGHVIKSHPWFTFCFVVRETPSDALTCLTHFLFFHLPHRDANSC